MVSHFQPTDTGFLEHIQFSLITSCFLILVQPSQYLGFYPLFCPPCKPLPSAMSSLQAPSPIGPLPPHQDTSSWLLCFSSQSPARGNTVNTQLSLR